MSIQETAARWFYDMDYELPWEQANENLRDDYIIRANEWLAQPMQLAIAAAAWDDGFGPYRQQVANRRNPYRPAVGTQTEET